VTLPLRQQYRAPVRATDKRKWLRGQSCGWIFGRLFPSRIFAVVCPRHTARSDCVISQICFGRCRTGVLGRFASNTTSRTLAAWPHWHKSRRLADFGGRCSNPIPAGGSRPVAVASLHSNSARKSIPHRRLLADPGKNRHRGRRVAQGDGCSGQS
jgi:hypothetical protein